MKVVCFTIYPEEAPSVRARVAEYAPLLRKEGMKLSIVPLLSTNLYRARRRFGWRQTVYKATAFFLCTIRLLTTLPKAAAADVVIIHREVFPLGPPWLELAIIRLSKRCIYDLDDAIWVPPTNEINQRALFWDGGRIPAILKHVDVAVAGSPHIASYMRQFIDRVAEIPTTCNDLTAEAGRQSKQDIPVVVWIGNWGNAFYLTQILDALESVARRSPYTLRLIGGPDIHDVRSNVIKIDYRAWSKNDEARLLASSDVGIMPLVDSDYERGKCAFKLIQYMSAGLPVVASPIGMNNDVVTPAIGMLADSNHDWAEHLVTLLSDEKLRTRMAKASRNTYLRQYSRERIAERLTNVIRGEICAPA